MKLFASNFPQHLLPLTVLTAVVLIINVRHLNEPPAYIHAWTQADNYSLALGFLHNGGDLFHPQTLIYNKQQYDPDMPETPVTACDLPLHHWMVAGLMSLCGSHEPWVFRSLTLAVSILGLWALYLLVFLLTNSRLKGLLVSVLAATAPAFAYYSGSFLPTTTALAMAIGGMLFYVLHIRKGGVWMLYASLALLTLSVMQRSSTAVLWVAVGCFEVLRLLRHETTLRTSWPPFTCGALLFAAWQLWNMHLRQEYGSLFLARLLPVRDIDEAEWVFRAVHDHWRFHYFQRLQHWLYVVVGLAALTVGIMNRHTNKSTQQSTNTPTLSFWWLLAIWFFGEILFAIALLRQFHDHDYYFLDSFFLPLVFLLAGLLSLLPNPKTRWPKIAGLAVLLALTVAMTAEACRMQQMRRNPYEEGENGTEALNTAVRFKHANTMLDEAGYGSTNLRFLALFAYPQNTPFCMMNRQGYSVMWNDTAIVNHALTFDYDYILIEDEVYRREFDSAQYILPYLNRLAGNGELSLCSLSDTVLHTTADHFFKK